MGCRDFRAALGGVQEEKLEAGRLAENGAPSDPLPNPAGDYPRDTAGQAGLGNLWSNL